MCIRDSTLTCQGKLFLEQFCQAALNIVGQEFVWTHSVCGSLRGWCAQILLVAGQHHLEETIHKISVIDQSQWIVLKEWADFQHVFSSYTRSVRFGFYFKGDLLSVLKATFASWIEETHKMAATHIANLIDTVISAQKQTQTRWMNNLNNLEPNLSKKPVDPQTARLKFTRR